MGDFTGEEYDSRTFTRADNKTLTRPTKKTFSSSDAHFLPTAPPPYKLAKAEGPPFSVAEEEQPEKVELSPSSSEPLKPPVQPRPVPTMSTVTTTEPVKANPPSETTPRQMSQSQNSTNSSETLVPDAVTPRVEERKPSRTRQQTVVVQSGTIQEVKNVFASIATKENPPSTDEAEKRMLSLIAKMEKENLLKIDKVRKDASKEMAKMRAQEEVNRMVQTNHIEELQNKMRMMATMAPILPANMTASTMLSPDDARMMRREKEQLESELQSVHETYRNMFIVYEQLKINNKELKDDNDHLKDIENRLRDHLTRSNDKYMKMVEQAKERLNQANDCIAQLEKKCDDDTVTLRARLRQKELQLGAAQQQLEIKTKEAEELNDICQALIQKAECVSDTEA